MSSFAGRLAGAPISWGVCEVPGWGWQFDAATVLSQMQEVGLVATEFGPDGFLPDEPEAKAKTLADKGLRAVGGFVPVVLHDSAHNPVPRDRAGSQELHSSWRGHTRSSRRDRDRRV